MNIEISHREYKQRFKELLLSNPVRQCARSILYYFRKTAYCLRIRQVFAKARPGETTFVKVPLFIQSPPYRYRDISKQWIEEFFLHFYCGKQHVCTPASTVRFLPILFDNFYLQAQSKSMLPCEYKWIYTKHKQLLADIGTSSEIYFTVKGIYDFALWDWHEFPKNCLVFSANGDGDIPIPLLHGDYAPRCPEKDLLVSFMGSLSGFSDSTGIRTKMYQALKNFAHFGEGGDWKEVMGRSKFTLCPRGLGMSSFRLYAISLHIDDIDTLPAIIYSIPEDVIRDMQAYICDIYYNYFTYAGTSAYIVRKLSQFDSVQKVHELTDKRTFSGYLPT